MNSALYQQRGNFWLELFFIKIIRTKNRSSTLLGKRQLEMIIFYHFLRPLPDGSGLTLAGDKLRTP
jgi:hypothetical protein